jgi:myo-inositol-1(or 4)-monophosphatase
MNRNLHAAVTAALDAGDFLKAEFRRGSMVRTEVGKDIKLEADVIAEERILASLRASTCHPILSEEAGADPDFDADGYYWVVDPLDGTFNFSRRLPLCCVSIGLWRADLPVLGVIHEFLTGRTFSGVVGEGAWVDDQPLTVSGVQQRTRAALATGFPSGADFSDRSLMQLIHGVQTYKKVRMIGSAALSLAYVAEGAMDAYREEGIYFWDVAAGLALVQAAGGSYFTRPTSRRWQLDVFASNGRLVSESERNLEAVK